MNANGSKARPSPVGHVCDVAAKEKDEEQEQEQDDEGIPEPLMDADRR